MMCHGEEGDGWGRGGGGGGGRWRGGKAIIPSSYSLPCTLSGGDVSIRMVWLGALSAITAMSCCAPCASGYQRGLSSRFVLGKRNKSGGEEGRKKEEKTAEKVPNRSGHLSLNVENVKDEKKKKGADWGKTRKFKLYRATSRVCSVKETNPGITRHDICKHSGDICTNTALWPP